jgi:hypothetical protein
MLKGFFCTFAAQCAGGVSMKIRKNSEQHLNVSLRIQILKRDGKCSKIKMLIEVQNEVIVNVRGIQGWRVGVISFETIITPLLIITTERKEFHEEVPLTKDVV